MPRLDCVRSSPMADVSAMETDLYQSLNVNRDVTGCWSRNLSVGIVAHYDLAFSAFSVEIID